MVIKKTQFNSANSFRKRYEQHIEICRRNKVFMLAVNKIRRMLKIPKKGFVPGRADFKQWLNQFDINGKRLSFDFKEINIVLEQFQNTLYTKPDALLEFLICLEDSKGNYFDLYFNEDFFILRPPTMEVYQNYVNEKPFVGVFEYILFNKIVAPKSNLIAIKERDFDDMNYILLAISPNTGRKDIIELWPEICKYQKTMKDYGKNKVRIKKNFDEDIKIYNFEKKLKKQKEDENQSEYIKELKEGDKMLELTIVDKFYFDNPRRKNTKINNKTEKRFKSDLRKRKSRNKIVFNG